MLRATKASYNVVNGWSKPRRHRVVCNVNAMFLCMSIQAIEAHVTKGACARRSPRSPNGVGRSPAVPLRVQSRQAGSHDLAGLCRASSRCLNGFGRSPTGQSAVGRSPGPPNRLGRSPGCDPARVVASPAAAPDLARSLSLLPSTRLCRRKQASESLHDIGAVALRLLVPRPPLLIFQ